MQTLKVINAVVAFSLELGMLAAFAVWGYRNGNGLVVKWLIAIALPVIVGVLWGFILAPKAPYRLEPTVGWKTVPNYEVSKSHPDYYLGMGLTAEEVAKDYKISREAQDEFSLRSHQRATKAIENGYFKKSDCSDNS